ALALLGADDLAPGDHEVLKRLAAVKEAPPLLFHYDAAALDEATVAAAVERNLGFFRTLEKEMRMRYEGRIHLFLYRDGAHLKEVTGSDAAAFSRGRRSVHQPHDYDDPHEMVHIFALQIPNGAESVPPDGFFVEGLATALQKEDNAIAIDDYAVAYLRAGRIPRLVELRRSWPQGAAPGVHPYHVAGSFLSFLISELGIEKTKTLYTNCLECQGIAGRSFARLERDWWDWLDRREPRAGAEETVLKRLGVTERIPKALADAKASALFDGRSLHGWNLEHPQSWKARLGAIAGETSEPWHRIHARERRSGDVAARVRLRLVAGDAVQVRLNRDDTQANEAIFAAWETFLVREGPGGGLLARSPYRILPGRWIEVVFVNQDGRGRVYVDGLLMLDAVGLCTAEGSVGISVERGVAEIREVSLLQLR
ncbi:MAG: hypothetical protein ACREID_10140, partial [Planctomycetota bacterium]